uniref:Uncharacterized protein n=1 Tax=Caenorhabditis japonica TaxID=281687 RepID=A0A8R1EPJ5_CAEJA
MKVQHHNNKLVPIRGFRIDITVLGGDDTEESIDCLAAAELDPAHPCSFVSQKLSPNRLDFQRLQFPRVILDGCSPISSRNEFRLVARLYASLTDDADFLIQSHVSDRFIILM